MPAQKPAGAAAAAAPKEAAAGGGAAAAGKSASVSPLIAKSAPAVPSGAAPAGFGGVKPKEINYKETNVAGVGSKENRDLKKWAAEKEPAWQKAGKEKGIQIWRIEKFQVKEWDKQLYGAFYSGDAYIILYTYVVPGTQKLAYNVHFWLGKDSSQDEQGVAAYKTVELDDFLGDLPVQYREVQSYEAPEFLKLFGGTVRYMDGGIESGFNHVTPTVYKPRLFWVKGASADSTRVTQVPLELKSLNDGDVFVVDNGLEIIQWSGKTAGIWEKRKGGEVATAITTERNGKPKTRYVASGDDDAAFWQLVGGKGPIPAAVPDEVKNPKRPVVAPAIAKSTKAEFQSIQLKKTPAPVAGKKAGQSSGAPVDAPEPVDGDGGFTESLGGAKKKNGQEAVYMPGEAPKAGGKLSKADLTTEDVFVFDASEALYTWVGKKASAEDRKEAIFKGVEYLKQHDRPLHTPVIRVMEGAETPEFWAAFNAAANA